MKNFEVLIQRNGRIQWMSVPGCINHAEARSQGEKMYSGKVLDTRYLGITDNKSSSSRSSWFSSNSDGGLSFLILCVGLIIVVSLWPLFLVGGLVYLGYKLYQKYEKNEPNKK